MSKIKVKKANTTSWKLRISDWKAQVQKQQQFQEKVSKHLKGLTAKKHFTS